MHTYDPQPTPRRPLPPKPLPARGAIVSVTDRYGAVRAGVVTAGTNAEALVLRTVRDPAPVTLPWSDLDEVVVVNY